VAWDWEQAARRAGMGPGERLNAGAMELDQPRALIWRRADGGVETFSGAELSALARRTATVLREAGVQPGDRVAGLLGRRPEAFTVPLATWRLGAVYVPLFSGFGPQALAARLSDSGTRFVVTDPANRPNLAEAEHRLDPITTLLVGGTPEGGDASFDRLIEGAEETADVAETARRDPATIMYTSGTTGPPKGCVIPHHGVISIWPFVELCMALSPEDVLFSTADTGWSFGLYTTGLSVLTMGHCRVLYAGGFDAAEWWETIRDLGVTHLASAPTGFRQLAIAGFDDDTAGGLRAATSAGEPLGPEVMRWWQEHVGVTIHDGFGLTEVGMVVANLRDGSAPAPEPGSMGVPVPGFEVELVEEGRIAVRDNGFLLSSTYWGRDELWDARLRDGWFLTEDLARRDEDGRYWFLGRADDLIVTAGYNVGPLEVETALLEHPHVVDAACVGEPDERKGQVVAAHVVLDGPEWDELGEELRRWVGERIGWHAAPRKVQVQAELPRTESGKLRRSALASPQSEYAK
jgi:acetyl-CoA synthetase